MKKLILSIALLGGLFTMNSQEWNGASNTTGNIYRTGKVGIGTTTPIQNLEVNGSFSLLTGSERLLFGDNTNENAYIAPRNDANTNWAWSDKFGYNTTDNNWFFQKKLSIGTLTPDANSKLTVKGKILCSEVEVVLENTIPADYVFEKYFLGYSNLKAGYMMPTLEEVEAFIKANHHLPEVPSAATIKEEGLQLKQMTNLLLQKIEELTLYTIEQEKRINALETKLSKKE